MLTNRHKRLVSCCEGVVLGRVNPSLLVAGVRVQQAELNTRHVCQTVELCPPRRRGKGMGEGVRCPAEFSRTHRPITGKQHRQERPLGSLALSDLSHFIPGVCASNLLSTPELGIGCVCLRVNVSEELMVGSLETQVGGGSGVTRPRTSIQRGPVCSGCVLAQAPTLEAQSQWLKSGSRAPHPTHCTLWREANSKGNRGVCVLS